MKRLISLPLALGIALATPVYASAASSGAAGGGNAATSGSSATGAPSPGANTGTNYGTERTQPGQTGMANPSSGAMAAQRSHRTDGTSRNKNDCVKTGCIDNGN